MTEVFQLLATCDLAREIVDDACVVHKVRYLIVSTFWIDGFQFLL